MEQFVDEHPKSPNICFLAVHMLVEALRRHVEG
jgi:hypothetical protein